MSHVDFKKRLCCPVEFKGQGPYIGLLGTLSLRLNLSGVHGFG